MTSGDIPNNPDHLGSPAPMDQTNKTTRKSSKQQRSSIRDNDLTPLPEHFGGRWCRDQYVSVLIFHPFYLLPDHLTFIPLLWTPFYLLRPVSVYTGPCQVHLDYSVLIVSMLLLHFLSVLSASIQSCWWWKRPVRHYGLRPSIWPLLLVSFGSDTLEFDSL